MWWTFTSITCAKKSIRILKASSSTRFGTPAMSWGREPWWYDFLNPLGLGVARHLSGFRCAIGPKTNQYLHTPFEVSGNAVAPFLGPQGGLRPFLTVQNPALPPPELSCLVPFHLRNI